MLFRQEHLNLNVDLSQTLPHHSFLLSLGWCSPGRRREWGDQRVGEMGIGEEGERGGGRKQEEEDGMSIVNPVWYQASGKL